MIKSVNFEGSIKTATHVVYTISYRNDMQYGAARIDEQLCDMAAASNVTAMTYLEGDRIVAVYAFDQQDTAVIDAALDAAGAFGKVTTVPATLLE